MSSDSLFRLTAWAAIIGGGLRVVSAFIPFEADNLVLESYYTFIDLALLAGMVGLYVSRSEALRAFGFAGFALAAAGKASIVGPDPIFHGVDLYYVGVAVILCGLILFSLQIIRTRAYPAWIAGFWLATPFISLGLSAAGFPETGFFAGGITYAAGFIGGGAVLLSRLSASHT